jgi:tetratricopeptide (TPR) repeat protein
MSRSVIPTNALVLALALWWGTPAHAQRPGHGDDESAALVGEGRAALRRGELEDAAKALDQAIALNPLRVEAYVLRSAVYEAKQQYQEGVLLMRRAQALAPADESVLAALGSQLVLSGDPHAGAPLLDQVVARNPSRYDAALVLGRYWYTIGQWPDAIAALETYFGHRPRELANEDGRHRVDLADAYLRDHQAVKALAAFRQAAREDPSDLRARLGVAWATAAMSCRDALPLLRELEPLVAAYPEIWLVEGRCALAVGDAAMAKKLGEACLARARQGAAAGDPRVGEAAGHALIGEAYASLGKRVEAARELETARDLDPAQRRWTIRLAVMLRDRGDAKGALAALGKLGPPARAVSDPDWWIELGNALLANGDRQAVIAQLTPIASALPTSAAIHAVLGTAQLGAGQAEAAVKTLEAADAIASTPRSRQQLAEALATVAVARLSAGEAAEAEPLLVRANALAASATSLRNLGIARLALDRTDDAIAAFDRAVALEPVPIALMLAARAHALAGDVAGARARYARGFDPTQGDAVEIAIDWAASELAGGDPAIAVAALERASARAASGPLAQRHRVALAEARHAAGLAALRAGNGARAVALLKASLAGEPAVATRCDLALAAVVSGDATTALGALAAVRGKRCPFPPPADLQAVPILIALAEGLNPRRAGTSLAHLSALASKSSGAAAALLGMATRVVALEAAGNAYRAGRVAQARRSLATARGAHAQLGGEELAHDLALLDLADGQLDAAIAQLERLAPNLPDALVTLGIAYERRGEPQNALDAWQRARKAGSRFAPLTGWIEAKQRFYGALP